MAKKHNLYSIQFMIETAHRLQILLVSFTNIDITHQAEYFIQVCIRKGKKQPILEQQSMISTYYKTQLSQKTISPNIFCSDRFFIQYNSNLLLMADQEVKIDKVCDFNIEPINQQNKVIMQITLMKRQCFDKIIQKNFNFQIVCQQDLQIDISLGLCQYYQLKLKSFQSSLLKIIVIALPNRLQLKFDPKKEPNSKLIKRQMKKYRYNFYIIGRDLWECLKNNEQGFSILLPKIFLGEERSMQNVLANQKSLFEYLSCYQNYGLSISELIQQMSYMGIENERLIDKILDHIERQQFDYAILQKKYKDNLFKRYQKRTFHQNLCKNKENNQERIKKIRKIVNQDQTQTQKIKHTHDQPLPIIVVSTEIKKKPNQLVNHQVHNIKNVFIIAHGFNGSQNDMINLRNSLKQNIKSGIYIILNSFSEDMKQSIQCMGLKASEEIIRTLKDNKLQDRKLRIFMIGQSMGGLILRASLQYLSHYQPYFDTYISLGTPHLGYLQQVEVKTKFVLKIINSFAKIASLKQISNKDNQNPEDTFIYYLSQYGNLGQFKNVILVSSLKDSFVPWHSARIEVEGEKEKDKFLRNMVNNIFEGNKLQRIERIQIDYVFQEKSISTMIGKAAHVSFLSNQHAVNMLLAACKYISSGN